MILVFDLGGPLVAYALLRSAGMSAVAALVISGVLPALGIAVGALVDRRLDVLGVLATNPSTRQATNPSTSTGASPASRGH